MSGYGGFGGGNDGGGGFMQGSQGGSQGATKSFAEESLRPVTIKQIIDAQQGYGESIHRIDGIETAQITFVGMVRSISPQITNITYRLDDGTGIVEVKQWLDSDKQEGEQSQAAFQLDQYVRIWGRIREFHNKRHVGAHRIKPVTDFNEVNYHLLEATYIHLYFTKGDPQAGAGKGGGDGDSMFVDGGYGGDSGNANNPHLAGCSAKAKKVFQWLNNAEGGNEGVHLHMIAQGTGMSVPEVSAASEELIGPGLIYTTVDDETFAILSY